ncbi:MAG: signal peptidase I [Myxococcales bacterium]|nr:signal peptidase I [Myxococcales bacterium]
MSDDAQRTPPAPRQVPLALMLVAGLFLGPGAGHFLVKKWRRGIVLAALFLAATALVKVLSAVQPSPVTVALTWLPVLLRIVALLDLVRIPPDERVAEQLAPAALGAVAVVAAWFGLDFVVRERVTQLYAMPSGGMLPTIAPGDQFVVSKLLGAPGRGDVVVVAEPGKPTDLLAKRVIGIGGDRVELTGARLRINDEEVPLCEVGGFDFEGKAMRLYVEGLGSPHLVMLEAHEHDGGTQSWSVPPGELFVMGDNRDNSHDSRAWNEGKGGSVSAANIAGRVTFFMMRAGELRVEDVRRIALPKGAEKLRDKVQPCLDQIGYRP